MTRCAVRPERSPGDGSGEFFVGIDERIRRELDRIAPGAVFADEPMARHTSLGLGGPADLYVEPSDVDALRDTIAFVESEGLPLLILGRGTNLLVRDGGIDGVVVATARALAEVTTEGETLAAGGGASLARALMRAAEAGLAGIEQLSGIPGSVGGAVATNAGSFGVSIGELVETVEVCSGEGASTLGADALAFGYRSANLPEGVVVERVRLRLVPGDPAKIAERGKAFVEQKWRTQPAGMRSAGCVFRNPPGNAAGRLIDQAGLKGLRIGGAVVSDLHANYIVNDRGATAADVEDLVETVRRLVAERMGVPLTLEIEIIGRAVSEREELQ